MIFHVLLTYGVKTVLDINKNERENLEIIVQSITRQKFPNQCSSKKNVYLNES